MPCLLWLVALAFPRVVLVLVFLFSHYLQQAYQTWIWPVLGFFLMPYTTLAYAWAMNANGSVSGFYLFVVVLAALVDVGHWGGGTRHKYRKYR